MRKNNYVKDMTEGNEVSLLVKFALPMLVGNLFQQFYNMVDSMVVGNYVGANALAAVGATSSLNFLFFSLCMGMSSGIGILLSQYFGAKDEKQTKKTIANAVYIMFATGVIMSVLGTCLARSVLSLLKTPPEIIVESTKYMQIVSMGILAVAAYNTISALLRALGDSKTPLIFLVVASVINVILDLSFVVLLHLGVAGVAYATIIAQIIAAVGLILFALIKNPYFKIERKWLLPDKAIIRKSIKIGIPVGFQNALIAISCVALQTVVNQFGATVVAVFTTTARIEQLVQQPYGSLGMAISTFTGQNIGAEKLERVKRGYRKSMLMVVIFSAVMLVLAWSCAGYIVEAFVKDAQVIYMGKIALRITSLMYFPLGTIYVTRGLLNGAGDTMFAVINGGIEVFGRVVFPSLLVMLPFIGVWGIWLSTGLTWVITAAISYIRYRKGRWKNYSIVRN